MKRSAMPRGKGFKPRTTGLPASPSLRRTTPLRSNGKVAKGSGLARKPVAAKPKKDPMPQALRDLAWARAGGLCDCCGLPLGEPWECHHRVLRSHGGPHAASNLLALRTDCHARAHSKRKEWGEPRGLIVRRTPTVDFHNRPVLRHGRDWVIPTDSGWLPADAPDDYTHDEKDEAA